MQSVQLKSIFRAKRNSAGNSVRINSNHGRPDSVLWISCLCFERRYTAPEFNRVLFDDVVITTEVIQNTLMDKRFVMKIES